MLRSADNDLSTAYAISLSFLAYILGPRGVGKSPADLSVVITCGTLNNTCTALSAPLSDRLGCSWRFLIAPGPSTLPCSKIVFRADVEPSPPLDAGTPSDFMRTGSNLALLPRANFTQQPWPPWIAAGLASQDSSGMSRR